MDNLERDGDKMGIEWDSEDGEGNEGGEMIQTGRSEGTYVRDSDGRFVQGTKAPPAAIAKRNRHHELARLIRSAMPAKDVVERLLHLANQNRSPKTALAALEILLDRGWGKVPQTLEVENDAMSALSALLRQRVSYTVHDLLPGDDMGKENGNLLNLLANDRADGSGGNGQAEGSVGQDVGEGGGDSDS